MAEPKRHDPAPPSEPARGGIAARAMDNIGANRAMPYLHAMNPEQRAAVEALDGPVLVLAGAGTGKTRVLTTRIAHILNLRRAHPSEILAVTFTNKAAREMKERVGHMVGQVVEGMPWMGTFHSIGVKILRRHAELVGLKANFTILDTDDQIRLLKQLLEAERLDEKRWPGRVLASLIDGWKNRGLTPEQVPAGEAASFANGKGKKFYTAYQERLKTLNAADFGDLLLECIRLFRLNPELLKQYQQRFKFILVDEYQDTNVAQYLWLRLLAQPSPSTSPRLRGEEGRGGGAGGAPPRFRSSPQLPLPLTPTLSPQAGRGSRRCSRQRHKKTSAAWATTTSRSTAGAGRRSTTSCASSTTSPAPKSSGSSAITDRPATSSPPRRT
jgi:DNA helicase II / ATP-dependent DNA helicase PcrA